MSKYFIKPDWIHADKKKIQVQGEDVKHIKNVLRARIGDAIVLCDGACVDYDCVISQIERDMIVCDIIKKCVSKTEPKHKITLFQGLPKGDKFEEVIQKSVELGVYEIVPMATERAIVKWKSKDMDKKTERYQKIAMEACKQSNRGVVPQVNGLISFDEMLAKIAAFDLFFVPYELEEMQNIRLFLETKIGSRKDKCGNHIDMDGLRIGFCIGPEGGFSDSEIQRAKDAGVETVSLGKRILRTQTAGPAVIAMLRYALNDF